MTGLLLWRCSRGRSTRGTEHPHHNISPTNQKSPAWCSNLQKFGLRAMSVSYFGTEDSLQTTEPAKALEQVNSANMPNS